MFFKIFSILSLLMVFHAYASVETVAAKETKAKYFIDIEFDKGNYALNEKAKIAINAILDVAKKHGKIEEMIVLSWSDTKYPANSVRTLSKVERKLADKRNRAVEKYAKSIADLKSLYVDTYNMEEKPNSMSRWLKNYDYQIKNSLTAENNLPTKAAHSVILVRMKE